MPTTTTGMGGFTTVFDGLSTTLTTAYTGNQSALDTHGAPTAAILIDAVSGGATSIQVQVEVYNNDTATWHVLPLLSVVTAALVYTTASHVQKVRFGIDALAKFETQLRISAKVVGSADATTALTVKVALGSSTYTIAGNVV